MPFKITQFLQASLFAFICSHQVIATDDFEALDNSMVSISGFGSLFVTQAGEENLGYYNDFSNHPQTKNLALSTDSNIGIQLDAAFTSQFSSTLQLVFKNSIKKNLNETIKWANLKYQVTPDIQARIGRMGLDIHMLSEYRDVGFAYLWTRPIAEFYTPVVFDHFDGIDISKSIQLETGVVQLKLFTGKTGSYSIQTNSQAVKKDANLYGASLLFENHSWKLRTAFAKGKITKFHSSILDNIISDLDAIPRAVWPGMNDISDQINPDNAKVTYYSIGLSYDSYIQVQSELSLITVDNWDLVPSTYSGYISLAKSFKEVTPFIVFSSIKMKSTPYQVSSPFSSGNPLLDGRLKFTQLSLQTMFNTELVEQQTISLGFRWDLESNLALKAQWDHSKIKNNYSSQWEVVNYPSNSDTANTFSMGLNFIF